MSRSRTRSLVLTGLCIALIASGAFIMVPLGPIPFTLQTMMIGIVVCLLPPAYSVAAVGGYLALGCFGLPVFSGFRGGIGVLAGPTGGFLIGFLLAAIVIALIRSRVLPAVAEREKDLKRSSRLIAAADVISLILLSLLYYALGFLWFLVSTGTSIEAALAATVLPFIIPDLVKAIAAFICVKPIRAVIGYKAISTG